MAIPTAIIYISLENPTDSLSDLRNPAALLLPRRLCQWPKSGDPPNGRFAHLLVYIQFLGGCRVIDTLETQSAPTGGSGRMRGVQRTDVNFRGRVMEAMLMMSPPFTFGAGHSN